VGFRRGVSPHATKKTNLFGDSVARCKKSRYSHQDLTHDMFMIAFNMTYKHQDFIVARHVYGKSFDFSQQVLFCRTTCLWHDLFTKT
jgi:hypothetical protein